MKEFVLSEQANKDKVLKPLVEELKAFEARKGKIYISPAHEGSSSRFFLTTSKELHLALGQLSESARAILARFATFHLIGRENSSLLIFFDEKKMSGMLVTHTQDGKSDMLHLSVAH